MKFFSGRLGIIFWLSAGLALLFPVSGMGQHSNVSITAAPSSINRLYESFLQHHPAFRFKSSAQRGVGRNFFQETIEKKYSPEEIAKLAEAFAADPASGSNNPLVVAWFADDEAQLVKTFEELAKGRIDQVEMKNERHTRNCRIRVGQLFAWVRQNEITHVKAFSGLSFEEALNWITGEKAAREKHLTMECEYSCDGDLAAGAKIRCRFHGDMDEAGIKGKTGK